MLIEKVNKWTIFRKDQNIYQKENHDKFCRAYITSKDQAFAFMETQQKIPRFSQNITIIFHFAELIPGIIIKLSKVSPEYVALLAMNYFTFHK